MAAIGIGNYFLDTPHPRPPCNWQQPATLQVGKIDVIPWKDSYTRSAFTASCELTYQVDGRLYTKWDDCGIRGTQEQVKLQLARANPTCNLWYDPKQPNRAISYCNGQ